MARRYRVVDCRHSEAELAEYEVLADNPEHAARMALSESLVRGSSGSRSVRAKVYSENGETRTMVRLYAQSETRDALRKRPLRLRQEPIF